MYERFEGYVARAEQEGWSLVELRDHIAIIEHPKGRSRTLYLVEADGELYVVRERPGRHELPGPNHL